MRRSLCRMKSVASSSSSSSSVMLPLLLLLVATATLTTVAAQQENTRFDPDEENATVWCTVPPYQDVEDYFQPKQGQCSSTTTLDLSTISNTALDTLAAAYAPVLFFHPLEKYTLSSVDATFADPTRGTLYQNSGGTNLIEDSVNLTTLLQTSRDPIWALKAESFFFTLEDYVKEQYYSKPEEVFGDGYDIDGKSRAKIYYNAFDSGNGTWTFNYWLYYEYNGEGNMGIVTHVPGSEEKETSAKTQYWRFHLKPYGIHEGDWEAVSVMICPPTSTEDISNNNLEEPLAVNYRQHSWSQITDCTRGECKLYKDTNHPVGFAALNSHATYVDSADDLIYVNVELGFFYNLQAFLVVDRTMYKKADGSYNYFLPNATNVVRLQDPANLTLDNTALQTDFWQGFGGNWGSQNKISLDAEPPQCLAADQLSFAECPTPQQDPVFDVVMQLMAVREPTTSLLGYVQSVSDKVVASFALTSTAPKGPVTKHYYEKWVPPKQAPFWKDVNDTSLTGAEYCTKFLTIPDISTNEIDKKTLDTIQQIYALVATVAVLTFLNFLIPLLGLWFQQKRGHAYYQPIRFTDDGNVPYLNHLFYYSIGPAIYTFFFLVMMAAGVTFLLGSESLLDTLEEFVTSLDWDIIREAVKAMSWVILGGNLFLLIFMWLQVYEMRRMIQLRFLQLTGSDTDSAPPTTWDQKFVPWSPLVVDILFRFCFAILFLSLMLAMICVLLGIAVVGFAAAFVETCNTVFGSLGNVCLDLNFIGIPQVSCGAEFQQFCNMWARDETVMILWASFFVFVSHFYVIAATGLAFQQRRSIPAILALYPVPPLTDSISSKGSNHDGGREDEKGREIEEVEDVDPTPAAEQQQQQEDKSKEETYPEVVDITQQHDKDDGAVEMLIPATTSM